MSTPAARLSELLHRVFGHGEFRAHQQPVCEAAASGRDVLLVMPTGAGKSLCYQLPALARGGTALVISPLIALMDDQAAKLQALKLRVGRIHSGLSRESSREVCREYLAGQLDFLFIAPERLRVPGFPEMLAKRKPVLVAIDEAHCISAWGHDFRPDYRTLGQHLPMLRPAPVIALTATATPTVQRDILRALNLQDPAVFITGFRRDNLHIEVTELSKPQRPAFIAKLLSKPEARPAIVYASSRKAAEEIASSLAGKFPTAAYHAGLDAGTRDRVQRSFLDGKLDVVVATVAFGMGVDKADVRTVVHAALPGSVEAYYQEIGRGGRDGQPARAVLLHSFADRKTQEFLMERSYPPVGDLCRLLEALRSEPMTVAGLRDRLKMDFEQVQRGTEKLLAQGVGSVDMDGTFYVNEGTPWQDDYEAQVQHRREQIDRMVAFAETNACRMGALVRHFGDLSGGARPCGNCDICQPGRSASSPTSKASTTERKQLRALLEGLGSGARSAGKLFTDLQLTRERKEFDRLVDGLARAGLLHVASESFRAEDGRDISFRKLSLTREGETVDDAALDTVWLREAHEQERPGGRAGKRPDSSERARSDTQATPPLDDAQTQLLEKLKAWRSERSKAAGSPAFLIFGDVVLRALAERGPRTLAELGTVRGIGPDKSERYGAEVLAICRGLPIGPPPASERGPQGRKVAAKAPRDPRRPAAVPKETVHVVPSAQHLPGSLFATGKGSTAATSRLARKVDPALDARLREWRREQATEAGLPSFFILSETALRRIATFGPQTLEELRSAGELSEEKLARYGAQMIALCQPAVITA